MEHLFKGAVMLLTQRSPRRHTKLQILNWLVARSQKYRRAASK